VLHPIQLQALALRAVEEFLNRRTAHRDALLAQILDEDAGVLRRLADA
jgi:hypothetical protein